VRIPDERGHRHEQIAEFATTVRGLLALRDRLAAHRVEQVVMEATGVYWKAQQWRTSLIPRGQFSTDRAPSR
jgi:hypothetical protein